MTDRELLELAAKAANVPSNVVGAAPGYYNCDELGFHCQWNPLTDDGDRYRLISKLKAIIDFDTQMVMIKNICIRWPEDETNESRAVVRAAAEIGKYMK
jgi:hypothetical protein